MNKKVSLKDVAAHCGVSAVTVSCVVRGVRCVKASTREKIEAAIVELGYQIDPTMRALAAYRTHVGNSQEKSYKETLAFLDPDATEYSQLVYDHCHQAGKRLGYDLKYVMLPETHEDQAALSARFWAEGIRGIILGPARGPIDLGSFNFKRFAAVGIGTFHHSPSIDVVTADYFYGLYMAGEYCLSHGRRAVGLLLSSYHEKRTGHRWLGAYQTFCSHYQIQPAFWLCEINRFPDIKKIEAWVKKHRIDAILTLATYLGPISFPNVLPVYLSDGGAKPGDCYVGVPIERLAHESLRLLDDHLIHQRLGTPEWPIQVAIQPNLHGDGAPNRPESGAT